MNELKQNQPCPFYLKAIELALADREDFQQIIYSLERVAADNESLAARLMAEGDYSAEFPGNDARNIRKAIELLKTQIRA